MRGRLRVLVMDEEFPYPLNTGKRIRTFSLVRTLTASHDVSYLAYGDPRSDSFRFIADAGMTCHAVAPRNTTQSGPTFYGRLMLNLFSPLPYIVTSHYTRRYSRQLRELVSRHKYDLVLCEWTPYAVYLRTLPGIKSVVVAHNIESDIWRRYEEQETNPLRRAYIAIQRRKVESYEKSCFFWGNGAVAVSDIDARRIEGYGVPYQVQTIENGVDLDYFQPREDRVDPDTLVFTGAMDWRPNQDAAIFFVRDVLPIVKAARPNVRFVVVGRNPPKVIQDLERVEGVTVTGTVEDVRPFIAGAALYVVPLRIGGGSRLKILEALAMQKPVLSTSVGAEGLTVTHGENVLLADGRERFAAAIVSCLDDPDLRDRIGRAGRQLVEERYGWEKLGEKLQGYLIEVAGTQTDAQP